MKIKSSDFPREIFIVNVHSSMNAGDFALLLQTIYYIKIAFGEVNIRINANWPNEALLLAQNYEVLGSPWKIVGVYDKNKKPRYQVLSFFTGILFFSIYKNKFFSILKRYVPDEWARLFNTYQKSDLVIAVAGNQLFSSGRFGWPLPIIGFPIFLAEKFKIPVVIFPQSIGPFKREWEKRLVKYIYDRSDKLFLRDSVSVNLAKNIGIEHSSPQYMPDLAFTFPEAHRSEGIELLTKYGFSFSDNNIGMTIISTMPSYLSNNIMENYYKSVAEALEELICMHGFKIFLFCQVSGPTKDENDEIGINNVIEILSLNARKHIVFVNERILPAKLKACYGLMDLFIATRLHSGIFSLGMNVPTLFIGYLDKTIGVLNSLGMENFFINLIEISKERIVQKTISMWKQKKEISTLIQEKMEKVKVDLAELPNIIHEEICNG